MAKVKTFHFSRFTLHFSIFLSETEKSKTIDGKSKDINILSNNIKDNDDNDSWIVNVTEPVDLSVIFLYYLEKDFSNGQRN